MKNATQAELAALFGEYGATYIDSGAALVYSLPQLKNRAVRPVGYLAAYPDQGILRVCATAREFVLPRESRNDMLTVCNLWSASRSYPRPTVIELDDGLTFGVDAALYTTVEIDKKYVKERFIDRFNAAAIEFFDAAFGAFMADPETTEEQAQ